MHGYISVDSDKKFDNDNSSIPKAFVTKIFQYCVRHNYMDETNGLQYDQDGEECNYLVFKILQSLHQNNKYLVTKRMFDLTCNIYFLPVTETNLQILNLSNKIIDGIIGGLEKVSDVRINTTEKIKLYNQTFKILNKSTGHLIQLLSNEDDKKDKMKYFKEAMIDPFQNIRDYITERVSFLIVFLTYNWNKIFCNLPSAYLPNNMKYRSLMSPLSNTAKKRSVYDFIRLFLACIPLVYQNIFFCLCIPLTYPFLFIPTLYHTFKIFNVFLLTWIVILMKTY